MTLSKFEGELYHTAKDAYECSSMVERNLSRILRRSSLSSPDVSVVVAETLTVMTRMLSIMPLRICKICNKAEDIRSCVEATAHVLQVCKPEKIALETNADSVLESKLQGLQKFCDSKQLPKGCCDLLIVLCNRLFDVSKVLKEVLEKKHKSQKKMELTRFSTKRLFKSICRYFHIIKQPILCLTYNTIKLHTCVASIEDCKPENELGQRANRMILKIMAKFIKNIRTLSVLTKFHHQTIKTLVKHLE